MRKEAMGCEAKPWSCTYCASKVFNEADCSFFPHL